MKGEGMIRIGLVGNPNSGKTTLFNALTGSTAHVGNWPGVTVDKKEGVYKKGGLDAEIIDLPGIYSLSPYTPEEVVARNYILDERPDCIINIVDVTNLERNLYLTTQIMELDVPIVIALNMSDVLEKNGDKISEKVLEQNLGVPVVKISALRENGMDALMARVEEVAKTTRKGRSILAEAPIGKAIKNAENALALKEVDSPLFHAVKLVEKDELEVLSHPREAVAVNEFVKINCSVSSLFGCDTEAEIADARYKYITSKLSVAITRSRPRAHGEMTKSDKADTVLTNRFAAIPIFLVILFAIFHLTFSENFLYLGSIPAVGRWCAKMSETTVGGIFFSGEGINSFGAILFYAMDLLTSSVGGWLEKGVTALGASPAVVGFLCDGVWSGISAVLSFVPQIMALFLFLSILEDSGYMARVAFILDKIFRRFGVSGRAFMPMIMGFGCSVPAMMNTRTLADEKERTATLRVIPFFSCGAKLPILTAIAGAIVNQAGKGNADIITYSMYVIGIVVAILSLLVMRSTTMRGEIPPFIMELPSYRMPSPKSLVLHLWDKVKHYIEKAFTVILVSCVAVWVLSNFAWDWTFLGGEDMENSILGSLGKFMQVLFAPLGFGSNLEKNGWVFAVAVITGLIAKENVIATFGTIAASLGLATISEDGVSAVAWLIGETGITTPALLAFIVFNMTTVPCFAAVAAAKSEVGKDKFKWTLLFWLVTSYIAACVVYCFGTLFTTQAKWSIWACIGWGVAAILAIVGITVYNKVMKKKENQAKIAKEKV